MSASALGRADVANSDVGMEQAYRTRGYAVIPDAVPQVLIDSLLQSYLEVVAQVAERQFDDAHGKDLADWLNANPDGESAIYDRMRSHAAVTAFCVESAITQPVTKVLGGPCGLLKKIPFRVDLPLEVRELAHWHQDVFYVGGSHRTVTAWIPLQDVAMTHGPLSVMPGSQLLGALDHPVVIGKRHCPDGIFDREIRMLEVRKGGIVLFSALLLHSSNLNLSGRPRYAVQARYTPLGEATDPRMGGVIPVSSP